MKQFKDDIPNAEFLCTIYNAKSLLRSAATTVVLNGFGVILMPGYTKLYGKLYFLCSKLFANSNLICTIYHFSLLDLNSIWYLSIVNLRL